MRDSELHKGHRKRVRDRYIESGLDSFEPHQIVELLLFYCIPMKDTNELAHKMIKEFGTFHNLLEAHPLEIVKRCGVSENVAVLISLIPSLSRRYLTSKWDKKVSLANSTIAGKFAVSFFTGRTVEHFYIFCLDVQKNLLYPALIAKGSLSEAPIYPREIVAAVLNHQASCIILAHNHPGGLLSASRSDIEATKLIKNVLEPINVDVLDHIIVAGEGYYSFAEKRVLNLSY